MLFPWPFRSADFEVLQSPRQYSTHRTTFSSTTTFVPPMSRLKRNFMSQELMIQQLTVSCFQYVFIFVFMDLFENARSIFQMAIKQEWTWWSTEWNLCGVRSSFRQFHVKIYQTHPGMGWKLGTPKTDAGYHSLSDISKLAPMKIIIISSKSISEPFFRHFLWPNHQDGRPFGLHLRHPFLRPRWAMAPGYAAAEGVLGQPPSLSPKAPTRSPHRWAVWLVNKSLGDIVDR